MAELGVLIAGELCRLSPRFTDRDQLLTLAWTAVEHPRYGVVYVVPRHHPIIEAPPGAIAWPTYSAAAVRERSRAREIERRREHGG